MLTLIEKSIHSKDDKVPYVSDLVAEHLGIVHAGIPLLIHQLYNVYLTWGQFHPIVFWLLLPYMSSKVFTTRNSEVRELGHKYGFLDGDKVNGMAYQTRVFPNTLTSVMLAGFVRPKSQLPRL